MHSETPAVAVQGLSKIYRIYDKPADRLKQLLWPGQRRWGREFNALQDVSFSLMKGEVLGLVGKNGAGKSTLLQMICGTLTPSSGQIQVQGRVAALLELGAGFNPDFTGRENIYLNGAVLGLSQQELDRRYDAIVDFAGIGDFIHQPVKTYSSGMYVRLAFSIATSVDPDILVVDEALSVGDGEFARKSFDRIMELKERGTTILFCSHSLFQVESICTRALWLNRGRIAASGDPAQVVSAYQEFLDRDSDQPPTGAEAAEVVAPKGHARLQRVGVNGEFRPGSTVSVSSLVDTLRVEIAFSSDPQLPAPSVAVTLNTMDGRLVASAGAWNDGVTLQRNAQGQGEAVLAIPELPLLKGRYHVSAYLFCERGLHLYAVADRAFVLEVSQEGVEQGLMHLPHSWSTQATEASEAAPLTDAPPSQSAHTDVLTWLNEQVWPLPVGTSLPAPLPTWTDAPPTDALLERFGLHQDTQGRWQKDKSPRWRLCWIGEQDREAWMALFQAAFGHAMPEAVRAWKYQNTPHMGVGTYAGDQLVAFYGGMPRQMRYKGQPAMAVQIGDVMVHPAHRGLMTRQGAFQMAAATFLEQQIGYDRPYLLGYGFPAFKSMALARHLGLYEQVDEVMEWHWNPRQARSTWQTRSEVMHTLQADVVDTLWAAMARDLQDSIVCARDSAHVAQRYFAHPVNDYEVLLVKARWTRRPLGLAVLRRTDEKTYEVLDWVAPLAQVHSVLNAVGLYAQARGAEALTAWITRSHAGLMTMPESQTVPTGLAIPTNAWTPAPATDEVAGRWLLMGGDTDFK